MELLVLGAAASYSDRPCSAASAYLLSTGGRGLLLDLGQGAFPALVRAREPADLEAIVVSHLHPDHFIDLVPLRHYLRYECRPQRRATVLGPPGLIARLDALHDEPGFAAASLDVAPLSVGSGRVGPFVLEASRVRHTDASFAFRVSDAGRPAAPALVYSGDCGRVGDLAPLIRPGDALLCEVSFGPGPVPSGAEHLAAPEVGRLAAMAGVGKLLLTHLQMAFDPVETIAAAQAGFPGEVRLVVEGDRIEV